jgi:MFS family permease
MTGKLRREGSSAILAMSFLQLSASALTPALAIIALDYPKVSLDTITLLSTLPSFSAIGGIILSGSVSGRKIKFRTMIFLGMLLILLGGLMPVMTNDLIAILTWRGVLGFGTGILIPLIMPLTLLSAEDTNAAKRQMGSNAVSMNVGAIIFQVIGGFCSTHFGWKTVFWIYIIVLPCILIVLFSFQEPDKSNDENYNKATVSFVDFRPAIWWFVVDFIYMIMFYTLVTRTAPVIQEESMGTANTTGIILSVFTVAGILGGFLYRNVKDIHYGAYPFLFLCLAVGFCIMAKCSNLLSFSIGEFISGIGFGLFNPAIGMSTGYAVEESARLTTASFLQVCSSVAAFVSSYVMTTISLSLGFTRHRFIFYFCSIVYAFMMIFFWTLKHIRDVKKQSSHLAS